MAWLHTLYFASMESLHEFDEFFRYVTKEYGKCDRTFTNLFGVTKETAAILYSLCVQHNSDVEPKWILEFLHWARQYPTEEHASFTWRIDPKTWRKRFHAMLITLWECLDTVCFSLLFSF